MGCAFIRVSVWGIYGSTTLLCFRKKIHENKIWYCWNCQKIFQSQGTILISKMTKLTAKINKETTKVCCKWACQINLDPHVISNCITFQQFELPCMYSAKCRGWVDNGQVDEVVIRNCITTCKFCKNSSLIKYMWFLKIELDVALRIFYTKL